MIMRRERKFVRVGFWIYAYAYICRTLHVDGFWAHGIGNEGAIRIEDEEGA